MRHFPVILLRRRSFRNLQKEKGVVAIIVALSLVALIGFVGLALDLGKLFVAKSELQNSTDACALAAVRELTGANTNQLTLAEAAGITAGRRHDVLFQSEAITYTPDDSVTFSQTLTGAYQPKSAISATDALLMRFARCSVDRSGIANWFIQVLNLLPGASIGDQTVAATAVASLAPAQTACAIPVGVCAADVPESLPIGSWLLGALNANGNISSGGAFMWVDYSPPAGGAAELSANLTGPGVCDLPALGSQVGQAGVASSLAAGWNSRFGISFGSVKQGDAVPDYSGYAYLDGKDGVPAAGPNGKVPGVPNKFGDFQSRRGSNAPYQGNAASGLRANGQIANSAYLTANGADRRMATVAVIDCPALGSGARAPVTEWVCVLMLHPINTSQGGSGTGAARMYLEYRGRSDEPGSPCAAVGTVGGPNSGGPLVPALVQ